MMQIWVLAQSLVRVCVKVHNDVNYVLFYVIFSYLGMIAFLLIPGACAIFAEDVLVLKRRPLIRDIVFYLISLVCLCWFFQDSRIDLHEAAILVSLYFVYIIVLVISPKIRLYLKKKSYAKRGETLLPQKSFVLQNREDDDDDENKEGENDVQIEENQSFIMKMIDVIGVPLKWLFNHTMPDVELGSKHENFYFLTFVISMVWTALFSFVISATVTRWVVLSGGSMAFFGLTLVAVGAQIPDAVSSIATAKRGYGSMAVSNSLGSQITNILIGMGIPWMCASFAGHDVMITEHHLILMSSYILTVGSALLTVVTLGVALVYRANKALLGKGKGWLLVVAYFVSVGAYAVILFYDL